jgi:hypothetical protein
LFSLFVNSLSHYVKRAKFLLFADDIKIYLKIESALDPSILQDELNIFYTWVTRLDLTLNLDKCHSIIFSRSRIPSNRTYSFDGSTLARVTQIKDLGIHFTSSLSFCQHIDLTVARSLKVLGFIKRNTKLFTSISCLRSLYFALVRSILEFGVVIWHPYHAKDQHRLERVQNRFLSFAAYILKINVPNHDYEQLRNLFNIPSLSSRRTKIDSNFLFALLKGTLDAPELLARIPFKVPTFASRNQVQFYIPHHFTAYSFNHPLHRMLRNANNSVP